MKHKLWRGREIVEAIKLLSAFEEIGNEFGVKGLEPLIWWIKTHKPEIFEIWEDLIPGRTNH